MAVGVNGQNGKAVPHLVEAESKADFVYVIILHQNMVVMIVRLMDQQVLRLNHVMKIRVQLMVVGPNGQIGKVVLYHVEGESKAVFGHATILLQNMVGMFVLLTDQ